MQICVKVSAFDSEIHVAELCIQSGCMSMVMCACFKGKRINNGHIRKVASLT